MLLFNSQADLQTELKHITTICRKRADGVIWEPVSQDSTAHVQQLTRQSIPVCYLNAGKDFPSYTIDFQEMGRRLTQKMIDHKHTRMLCLLEREDPRSEQVVTGFRKCLYDNACPFTRMLSYTMMLSQKVQSSCRSSPNLTLPGSSAPVFHLLCFYMSSYVNCITACQPIFPL